MSSLSGTWRAHPHARRAAPVWVTRLLQFDVMLVMGVLAMAAVGAVMVYSATRYELLAAGMSPHYWVKKDIVFLGAGAVVMGVLAFIDYHHWEAMWMVVFGATFAALLAVMLPGIGTHNLGSTRWISLGPFQFQPSAFAPLVFTVVAGALCAREEGVLSWRTLGAVVALAGLTMGLVAKQPDLGSAIVIGMVVAVILVLGGARARQIVFLGIVAAAGAFTVIHFGLLHGYQASRLTSFLHPNQHTNSTNYNLAQSKIDIGQGGLFGKGLFHDRQTNLQYVPEQHTDFIFTAVGGQLGFVGSSAVLVLYGLIVVRLWMIARSASDKFGSLLAIGAFAMFSFSVFENAGMTMGITPITGIPLPMMSYGGSADIAFFAAIGIALNVGSQSRGRLSARPGPTLLAGPSGPR